MWHCLFISRRFNLSYKVFPYLTTQHNVKIERSYLLQCTLKWLDLYTQGTIFSSIGSISGGTLVLQFYGCCKPQLACCSCSSIPISHCSIPSSCCPAPSLESLCFPSSSSKITGWSSFPGCPEVYFLTLWAAILAQMWFLEIPLESKAFPSNFSSIKTTFLNLYDIFGLKELCYSPLHLHHCNP